MLIAQSNLASTYSELGLHEKALPLRRDVYFGLLKLDGEEHEQTLTAANNYVRTLIRLNRYKEAKSRLRKTIPVARRVLGESHELTLRARWYYADALYAHPGATLDDDREAITTLEDAGRIARRVLGGAHPLTLAIEKYLQSARAALRAL